MIRQGCSLLQARNTLEWNVTRRWAPDSFAFLPDHKKTIGCLICNPSKSFIPWVTGVLHSDSRDSSRKMNSGVTLNTTHLTLY